MVRVTGLVDTNGGKKRFASLPIVIRFNATNQILKLETPFPIRAERDIKKFKESPSIKITSNGLPVDYQMDVIENQTFAFIKDYDKMLSTYNYSGGKAAILAEFESQGEIERVSKAALTTTVKCTNALAIEEAFLGMTPEQRQKFISWGVQHIND
ncbi:UPF0319 protein VPA1584 precursor [Vibrio ponticus]|nr:UPF0319 protein VPA1584 precursor [Vibrio ponticus]